MRWTLSRAGIEHGNKVEQVLMLTLFRAGAGGWGGGRRLRISEKNLFLLCYPVNPLGLYSFW